MALIKCPDCGRSVSDTAPSCPDCGRIMSAPAKKSTNPWVIIGWIVVALIVLPIATCTVAFVGSSVKSGSDKANQRMQEMEREREKAP